MPDIISTKDSNLLVHPQVVQRLIRQKGLDDNDSWIDDGIFEDAEPGDAPRRAVVDFSRSE